MNPGEFELIERFFRAPDSQPTGVAGVVLGIGDDAALLEVPPGTELVAAVDTLVEGRHFVAGSDSRSIGHRALAVNLSDFAAMGATPAWATLALTLPESDADWLAGFAAGLLGLAREFGVALVGGDTTRGPLTVSVQLLGHVPRGTALRRSGALAGDLIAVTGTLGEDLGWHYGFGAAGVGMIIGLIVYLCGRKWLPRDELPKRGERIARAPLTPHERVTILILVLLLPVQAIGIVGNQEIFNAYMLWIPAHVNLVFFGHSLLTTWLITLDAAVSITFLVASVAFWRLWARRFREPSEIMKMALGLMLCTVAVLCLIGAATRSAAGAKASFGWVLGFELFNSIGFSNVLPVGLALYARASPRGVAGTMIGVYFLHLFAANNLVGWLGGLLERLSGVQFWSLHALLVGIAALLTLFAALSCRRWLVPGTAPPVDAPAA